MAVTISGSDGISGDLPTIKIGNGSESAPAVTGQDTDTGLFFGTDTVGFSSSGSERMRLTSGGTLRIGQTTSDDPSGTDVQGVAIANGYISTAMDDANAAVFGRRGSDGSCVLFRRQTTNVGSISVNGASTAYNTSSDYRLKENVVELDGAIDRVKQLAPKRFNFIADADTIVDGFIAHEAQVVVPEAVTGTHDEVDKNGNAVMQGIDQSKLVPLLTGALKEAITKIEALETQNADLLTRVTTLEAAE